jgi:hypothetical protein
MSKDVYELGEPLQPSITNGLEGSIYMNADPPWSIVKVSSDSTVAPCFWLLWVVWAAPHQTLDYEYAPFQCDEGLPEPLEPGMYAVRMTYRVFVPPYPAYETSDQFCVSSECAQTDVGEDLQSVTWSRLKNLYR